MFCFRRSESPQALTRPRVLFFVLASARVTAPRPQSLAPSTSHANSEDERSHMENVVETTFIKRRAEPSACDSCPRAKTAPPGLVLWVSVVPLSLRKHGPISRAH